MSGHLTIVACPKAFSGPLAVIQRNAITSWTRLQPRPRIALCGNEPGTADLCAELGLIHLPDVERNARGTPLLRSVIQHGQAVAGALLCFINADIVLMSDFAATVQRIAERPKRFLMIGQRTDLDLNAAIDFSDDGWESRVRRDAAERGVLHDVCGIDYFVFTSGLFDPIPDLVIGRAGVDNWLVYRARSRWRAVIDATASITAIHQNHDYSHHVGGWEGAYRGEEARTNLTLMGGPSRLFWIDDRTHLLKPYGLKFDASPRQLRRHWDRLPVTAPRLLRPLAAVLYRSWLFGGVVLRALHLRRPLPDRDGAKV